jgi:hypothetical protein
MWDTNHGSSLMRYMYEVLTLSESSNPRPYTRKVDVLYEDNTMNFVK